MEEDERVKRPCRFASMEVALGCVYIPEFSFSHKVSLCAVFPALNVLFRAFSFGDDDMSDEEYMRLALHLAEKGCGWVSPNPMVGAVIVKEGRIIGRGWHEKYGGLHPVCDAGALLPLWQTAPLRGRHSGSRHPPGSGRLRRP